VSELLIGALLVVFIFVAIALAVFTDRVLGAVVVFSYWLVQKAYARRRRPLYLVVIILAGALAATVTLIAIAASGGWGG
jgi:hypothetical protein